MVHLAGGLGEERELTPEEAASAADRVSRHYAADRLVRLEVVRDGAVRMVRYLEREWPDEALLAAHRQEYGDLPFEVMSSIEPAPGGGRRRLWSIRGDGTLGEHADHELDDEGELLAESRYLPDGSLLGRTEYEFDDDGEISVTRELDGDGNVVSEWES